MNNYRLIFFGAPGVGKGTQAKIVSAKLNIPHISTGDILRNAIKNKTELGMKAKILMDQGELVPDDIMVELVKDVLNDENSKNGFILDGFPRTLDQAKILQPIVDELFDGKLTVIILDAEDKIIIDRLSQRRVCNNCSNIVNLKFINDPNKCPKCGAVNSFIKRDDDDEEVIKNRMEIFHKTTEPVLEFYRGKAQNYTIDGTLSVEEISNEIMKVLN